MRLITILLLVILSLSGFAQRFNIDMELETMPVIVRAGDIVIEAHILDGDKRINPDIELRYTWYKPNMIMSTRGGYDGSPLHGEYKEVYATNKSMRAKGAYKYGLKDGEWLTWYVNGELESFYNWKNGKLHGKYAEYDEEGNPTDEGIYRNGEIYVEPEFIPRKQREKKAKEPKEKRKKAEKRKKEKPPKAQKEKKPKEKKGKETKTKKARKGKERDGAELDE